MIKIVCCIVLLVNTNHSYSQTTKFSSYINSYSGHTYDLRIYGNTDGYTIWIDLMSYDKFNKQGSIILDRQQHIDFVTCLTEAKQKYVEWMERTKKINQKESGETLEMPLKTQISFRYGGRWKRSGEINLIWSFNAISKNDQQQSEYLLRVSTGMLHPANNISPTHNGFGLVFKSATEIQTLLDELTVEKIQTALKTHKFVH